MRVYVHYIGEVNPFMHSCKLSHLALYPIIKKQVRQVIDTPAGVIIYPNYK
jgi:hypothetical protein